MVEQGNHINWKTLLGTQATDNIVVICSTGLELVNTLCVKQKERIINMTFYSHKHIT